jgi:putative flippase GtrA
MIEKLKFIRYFIVAASAYLIDFFGFLIFNNLGFKPVTSNILSKVFASLYGFKFHRRFTYKLNKREGIKAHAIKYFSLVFLLYTPISSLVLFLMLKLINEPEFAKIYSDIILYFVTYFYTSKFIFNR